MSRVVVKVVVVPGVKVVVAVTVAVVLMVVVAEVVALTVVDVALVAVTVVDVMMVVMAVVAVVAVVVELVVATVDVLVAAVVDVVQLCPHMSGQWVSANCWWALFAKEQSCIGMRVPHPTASGTPLHARGTYVVVVAVVVVAPRHVASFADVHPSKMVLVMVLMLEVNVDVVVPKSFLYQQGGLLSIADLVNMASFLILEDASNWPTAKCQQFKS